MRHGKQAKKLAVPILWKKTENFILLVVLMLIWQLTEVLGLVNRVILPSPANILSRCGELLQSGILMDNVVVSMMRVLQGYCLASALAILLGLFIGLSPHCRRLTDIIVQILKPIPPIAWIPLVILWFGIGEQSKVFLIFIGGFFTILTNVVDGIRRTDPKLVEIAQVFETTHWKFISKVVLPSAMPSIFTGLRVGLGQCWMCVVAAELVASATGLGYMIMNARQFGQTDVVIIGMLTIGILGKLMNGVLQVIERRMIDWI